MNNRIKEIINKYRWSKEIRKYSNKHYSGNQLIYREIQSNTDVERAYIHISNHLETLSSIYPLHGDDIMDIEKTLARYEIAVNKVVTLSEQSINNPFSYTADELQQLIDNIYRFYDDVDNLKMRYIQQD